MVSDTDLDKRPDEEDIEDSQSQVRLERRGGMFNRFATPVDEDEALSKTEAVRNLFDYIPPELRDLALTRWRKREINLIANMLTQIQATNPGRPRYPDLVDANTGELVERGRIIPLSELKIRYVALLRVAEEGAGRDEAMGIFRLQAETDTAGMLKD